MVKKMSAKSKKKKQEMELSADNKESAQFKEETEKTPIQEPEEKRKNLFVEYGSALKLGAHEAVKNFKEGIDREKLHNFKKETKKITKGGLMFTVGIISIVAIMIVIELHSNDRIYPGTKVGALEIGYMPINEATEKLAASINSFNMSSQSFILEDRTVQIPVSELGIAIAQPKTADMPVIKFNRMNMANLLAAATQTQQINIHTTFDPDKTTTVIENYLQFGDKKTHNATFIIIDKKLAIQPELHGVAIDKDKLMADLKANINALNPSPIRLAIVQETPRITALELEQAKPYLEQLLNREITIQKDSRKFTYKPIDYLSSVQFTEVDYAMLPGGIRLPIQIASAETLPKEDLPQNQHVQIKSEIQLKIDGSALDEVMGEYMFSNIEVSTSPAKIYTDPEGRVIIEGKGEDGASIPRNRLAGAMTLALNEGLTDVPVPVLIDKAPLEISEDLQQMGIKELLATGHSAYYGSPANRMFNINFGTTKYNGILIPPGEEFSFNKVLGPVEAGSGFKAEKVIKENKLVYEIGGGICQVSTTLYRAVLQAGLPITERKPHSWKVSYYSQSMGDGLDATIYPGTADVKFINDTPSHMLIQSYTDGAEAYFKLYGTADGRKTTLEGPFGGGLTYRWNRIIEKDGETTKEEIWSKYKPIPKDPINGDDPKPAPPPEPSLSEGPTI